MQEKNNFEPIRQKMLAEQLPHILIDNFFRYYRRLAGGDEGLVPESRIAPVESLPESNQLGDEFAAIGEGVVSRTALLKLNGGLGTTMGLDKAKSLLIAKEGKTFLDIVAGQAKLAQVPLVLMNSFATRQDSLALLKNYPNLSGKIPLDFLQHKVPKIRRDTLAPVTWPQNPDLEWCPPGHGDLYLAMVTSGMLETLSRNGIETLFVSNVDNLGASLDPAILGYFVDNKLPFMMEVTDRTESDKKGGHLALDKKGRFLLREIAQCPEKDWNYFQDIKRHRFFNTNNLWINIGALKTLLEERDYFLDLPLIRNAKTVDPKDKNSIPVYQIETAMGSAIAVFKGAGAIRVPRSRFAPVKNSNDLLGVQSDCYVLDERSRIVPNPARKRPPVKITLDDKYYGLVDDFKERFPFGPPSLVNCWALRVEGDVVFGKGVTLRDEVAIINRSNKQKKIEDGIELKSELLIWSEAD